MKRFEDVLTGLRYGLRHPAARAGGMLALVLFISTLLVLAFWWGPMKLEQWKYLDTAESKRKAWLDGKRSQELSQAASEAKGTVALLERKLSSELNQAQAVQVISRLAASHGVRVLSQSFEVGKKQEPVAVLFIDLTLLGSYQGLREILERLPEMNGWVEVLDANLESAGSGTQVKAQLTLAAYRYPQGSHGRSTK